MEITRNKAKCINNGKDIKQEVTYSDPYQEVKATLIRKTYDPRQVVLTEKEVKIKE